jgi:antitoxin (DNA-binding transcriptional repressor) of toxin-antitoxin stability system
MKVVGVRELKNRLSEFLRQVKGGEEVLITDRGQVVAELRPPRAPASDASENPLLEELVRRGLPTRAGRLVTSELSLLEGHRALVRAVSQGVPREGRAAELSAALARAAIHVCVPRLGPEVIERAARPLPVEPVRSLDALHLASALEARAAFPSLEMLSLAGRIRENARALGLRCLPR